MEQESLDNLKLLKEIKSDYQTIRLYELEDGRFMLTLDTFIQFIEGEDSDIYHKSLLKPILEKATYFTFNDFLILGGGDGILANYIYSYFPLRNITLVELDPVMIELFRTYPRAIKMNNNALDYCKVIIQDAKEYIKNSKDKFDAILCDFPDANSEELKKLYSRDFYEQVVKLLRPFGLISVQTNVEITKEVINNLSPFVKKIKTIKYEMPFLGEGIIVAGGVGK